MKKRVGVGAVEGQGMAPSPRGVRIPVSLVSVL